MRIKNHLAELVKVAIQNAQTQGVLPAFDIPSVPIERAAKPEYGDYATALPLKLARDAKRAPLQIAQVIAAHFPQDEAVAKAEAAPPGFINLKLSEVWLAKQVETIVGQGARWGNLENAHPQKIQVEHVSVNPTGPMHVGSGRNGAIGDTLANILSAAGHSVQREFYINDNGTQVRQFGRSLYATYAQAFGRDEKIPEDGYQGSYIVTMGQAFAKQHGEKYLQMPRGQAERELGRLGTDSVVADIRVTLEKINIRFDNWFSERSLYESGLSEQVFGKLKEKGLIYDKEDATWFAAMELGLEKDAVIVRSPKVVAEPDERPTYLAGDVAYVWNKLAVRKFDRAIYVWGSDHHGDVPRVLAAAKALGLDEKRVTILIYQFVNLKRGSEMVRMSKRTGEFVTLDELIEEVGADAVRFMLISQSANTTMDFDLELAKKQSDENPVYYVQYAHARIASILKKAAEQGMTSVDADLALLTHPAELELIRAMLRLPEMIELAAASFEPHHLPHYAMELAGVFHSFYKQCRVVSSEPGDAAITRARLKLVDAARITLARALNLMGVRAPDVM